jgi:hypothetical protein
VIEPASPKKLLVRAHLPYLAAMEYDDAVRMLDG